MVGDTLKLSLISPSLAAFFSLVSVLVILISTTATWAASEDPVRDDISLKIAKTGDDVKTQNASSGDYPSSRDPESPEPVATGIGAAPKTELVAGGIRARLKLAGAGVRFSAGSPAFAEITLTNVSGAKRVGAEIVLETGQARILDVSGAKAKLTESGNHQVLSVTGLRKGKPRKVTVELQLRAGDSGQDQLSETVNSLKITLRPPGDGEVSDSTIVTWPVADCAGKFYSEIVSIRDQNSDRMGKALKAAWRRDSGRPGRWLFNPPASSSKRVCDRWTRKWDSRRGRYRSRCTRYRTVKKSGAAGSTVTKEERAVFSFAGKYVRTRALDPQLSVKQHHGWVSQRVATDLRGFLKQDKHPAICSGAIEFADYFADRMGDVGKRAEMFEQNRKKAHNRAAVRTAELRDLLKAEPGGHPGWGTAPLSVTFAGADRTLQQMIADLADLSGENAPLAEVQQAGDVYARLKIMNDYTSKGGLEPLPAEVRGAILRALSLIEAADYISSVHGRYSELDQSITGSLTAVKKAHSEHCTCGR